MLTADMTAASASCEYGGTLGDAGELIEVSILVEGYITGSTENEVAIVVIARLGNMQLSGGGKWLAPWDSTETIARLRLM